MTFLFQGKIRGVMWQCPAEIPLRSSSVMIQADPQPEVKTQDPQQLLGGLAGGGVLGIDS